jgi:hypothetical protein
MNQMPLDSEAILAEQYSQPDFLPPLWRVIFQEAMRGHHILFPRAIVEMMQEPSALLDIGTPGKDLEEFCVHLFAAPDLKSIQAMIHFLTIPEQKQLFLIYIQLMKSIRDSHKESMN